VPVEPALDPGLEIRDQVRGRSLEPLDDGLDLGARRVDLLPAAVRASLRTCRWLSLRDRPGDLTVDQVVHVLEDLERKRAPLLEMLLCRQLVGGAPLFSIHSVLASVAICPKVNSRPMKVTLLGHASILVEMKAARCLMDPVFQDPFEDTAVVSCPRRTINLDKLPPIDLLVISHSHLDHFDIPSLAYVARRWKNCEVVCPKDHTIVYTRERLAFTRIHPEEPHKHFKLRGYELLTTHSNVTNVTEIGIVFKDASGTFWNQVDTVISPATAAATP